MFNPITLVALVIILGVCFITGLVYRIPTTPLITATTESSTTRTVYKDFKISTKTSFDSKVKLDAIMSEAQDIIETQKSDSCFEYSNLISILDDIENKKIVIELQGQHDYHISKYTDHEPYDISDITSVASQLQTFVGNFQNLKEYQSRLIMTESEFSNLEQITNFLVETTAQTDVLKALEDLYDNINYFKVLQSYRNLKLLTIDNSILAEFETKYIETATSKLTKIVHEMEKVFDETPNEYYTANLDEMKSLITNYKVVVEQTRQAIKNEIGIILRRVSGGHKLYNNENQSVETMQNTLIEAAFYISNDDVYYNQYQRPLNFGTASSSVTAYDHTYFIISIIGFLNILFGIFCAYKLFGRDRKNGKLDLLLSQKVKFGEVFAGKFFAIFFCTSFVLSCFTVLSFIWGSILYAFLPNSIFAVFNLQSGYCIAPIFFLLLKVIGIELQVIFWAVFTIFMMNMSRKFELFFGISIAIFVLATIGNILLNGQLWYCLLPFVHIDLTSFLGGATMDSGFLVTSLYASGNFFISLAYYTVIVGLLYNFTRQLFRKN